MIKAFYYLSIILILTGCASKIEKLLYVFPSEQQPSATFELEGVNGSPKPFIVFMDDVKQCKFPMKWDINKAPCPCEPDAPPLKVFANREVMFFSLYEVYKPDRRIVKSGKSKEHFVDCTHFVSFIPEQDKFYLLEFEHSEGVCSYMLNESLTGHEKDYVPSVSKLTLKNIDCEVVN